jgi:quercetin dioxygenase-like cupin family protein
MTQKLQTLWDLNSMPWEQVTDHFQRQLVSGENAMFAHLKLRKGCLVPKHSHHNEQLSYILSGRLRFLVGDDEQEVIVGPGQVLELPAHLPHSAEALADTEGIDIFSPPRQDWLDGTDAYLREGAADGEV